jgi:hypothetical protein
MREGVLEVAGAVRDGAEVQMKAGRPPRLRMRVDETHDRVHPAIVVNLFANGCSESLGLRVRRRARHRTKRLWKNRQLSDVRVRRVRAHRRRRDAVVLGGLNARLHLRCTRARRRGWLPARRERQALTELGRPRDRWIERSLLLRRLGRVRRASGVAHAGASGKSHQGGAEERDDEIGETVHEILD